MTLDRVNDLLLFVGALAAAVAAIWAFARNIVKAIRALDAALDSRILHGSVKALSEPGGVQALKLAAHEAAADALHGMAEPMLRSQVDHERRLRDLDDSRKAQGERIGKLEHWQGGAEVSLGILRKKVMDAGEAA